MKDICKQCGGTSFYKDDNGWSRCSGCNAYLAQDFQALDKGVVVFVLVLPVLAGLAVLIWQVF